MPPPRQQLLSVSKILSVSTYYSTNLEQIGSEKPLQTSFTVKNDYLYSLQSGAKINISDGSCPERIVTVTGHTDSIYKAFKLICNKFEEVRA